MDSPSSRLKKTMACAEDNYFHRLPTEVIAYIFDKIVDAKCLCICSSVSKLFAQLVLHTRFVSVQIRLTGSGCRSWSPEIHKFLEKLSCIEYASLQFSCDFKLPTSLPLLGYKSDSSSFILVSAKSLIDDTTGIEATCESEREYRHALLYPIIRHMFHFRRRFAFKKKLLALFPNLKNIRAVESTELGSIVWEEDIARITKEENPLKDFCVKLWTAPPLVKLPYSGCAIKDALLISIQEIEAAGHDQMNCFEEDGYRELAATMTKEYPCQEIPFMLNGVPAPDGWETTSVLNFVIGRDRFVVK